MRRLRESTPESTVRGRRDQKVAAAGRVPELTEIATTIQIRLVAAWTMSGGGFRPVTHFYKTPKLAAD
ncbi:MAG: hypothetical protein JWN03_4758 [Nocardia sp.]|nr:hypothetical protein [Nocardia sp.]